MNQDVNDKIEKFFAAYRLRSSHKGQVLVHAGDDPPGIFQLVSGQVREYDISDRGEQTVVNVFKPPAFFPMSWAINKTPNQYFFEALTDIEFHLAPAEDVINFLHENHDVTFDLLARVYSGTDGLLRRMAHLMGGTARTRLLFELIVEAKRFGQKKANGSYVIEISEGDLANRSGLSRETVSREIRALKGLVEVSRQGVIIHGLARLENELGASL